LLKEEAPPSTETPLILASSLGNIRLVRLFVEHGADVNYGNGRSGYLTPLMYAAMAGHEEVVIYLLAKGADVEMHTSSNDMTALMIASDYGKINIVKILLAAGANINALSSTFRRAGENDKTALMYAADYHCIDFYEGDWSNKIRRPINVAVIEQNEIVKLLISRGADVNRQTSRGNTALMFAVEAACNGKLTEIVRTLLECGADRSIRNNDGNTVLMLAEKNSNMEKDLIALLKE